MSDRASGILLHVSSLPSSYGIGDFGPQAYQFVDLLSQAKQKFWQILPLNSVEPVYGNSPYSSSSALAGNILFISPEMLIEEGWVSQRATQPIPSFDRVKVDYEKVNIYKAAIFEQAFKNFKNKTPKAYEKFLTEHKDWLEDYAIFVVIKKLENKGWNQWPKPLRECEEGALKDLYGRYQAQIEKIKFLQFVFHQQWFALKEYCRQKGIQIIGDVPIYVNDDSVDVWKNPQYFKLDSEKQLQFVAGVPPDYFSKTGQRWGNPVYRWDALKQTRYEWWIKRLRHNFQLFDMIRIDHFRGFVQYWEIPASEKTAVNGHWEGAPGDDFFKIMIKEFKPFSIIAEDLGIITDDVKAVMQRFGFPGMKILLFAFDGELETHPYIPKNYVENCIVYTGTHDNNTVRGWFEHDASPEAKKNIIKYFGRDIKPQEVSWEFVKLAMMSKARLSIVPLQDVLGAGRDARMNIPSTKRGNWQWRFEMKDFDIKIIKQLSELTQSAQRA